MSDLGMIGKKRYLVFYRGRGKGEKTDWKIQEYHTTLKDLDGTQPGQNAFVLCRLFNEHEKSIKDPNINDAGPAVSSTAVMCDDKHISAHAAENQLGDLTTINDDLEIENTIIELQQTVGVDALKPSTSPHNNPTVSSVTTAKSYLKELESTLGLDVVSPQECFDGKTLNTIQLSSCDQNSYNAFAARNEVPKATVSEVDFGFEDGLSLFELSSEPPDGVYDLATYGHEFQENSHSGVQFQYGSNEPYDFDPVFLDPFLNAPYGSLYLDAVSLSDLANEGQSPMNMEPVQPQIQLSVENFVQGTAPSRFRLQCKLQVRSCSLKPTTTEEGKTSEKHVLPDDPGDDANTTSTLSELQRILSDSIDNSETSQSSDVCSVVHNLC